MIEKDHEIDAAIVTRVTGGDSDAYAELMHRYEQKLLRYVVYLLHDEAAAADVVQDTFIKAYQNLRSYKPEYKFSSWIYRIAHNETMNAVRKNKHHSDADISTLPELAYDPHLAERIDRGFLKKDVRQCLEALEPKYREVVQLVYFEQMKYDEASDVLHVPTSTVGVWLKRAKDKLRVICSQKGAI
ncbi:RNA polymerase sigma factor [Candidatus Saccharibacteria bacterium]|nr:RNA polymerase sigma factor [Candidatus Saccharibacteria bacterium]